MACPAPSYVDKCPPMATYQIGGASYFYTTVCDSNGDKFYQVVEVCDGVPSETVTYFNLNWEEAEPVMPLDLCPAEVTVGDIPGATQYTEGDVDGSITGTAVMWEDAGDTLRAVSAANPLPVDVDTSLLATEASQVAGNASLVSIDGKAPALGQALAAASVPVVLTAAQVTTLTPPAAIAGFATAVNQTAEQTLVGAVTEAAPATDIASSGLNGRLQRIAQRITSLITLLPTSLGQKTKANSFAVTLASDQDVLQVAPDKSSTVTHSNVTAAMADTTLLAANAARTGATIYNDSTAVLRVKFGTGASATSLILPIAAGGYYEVPFRYTGQINGIWDAVNGAARIGEFA